MRILLQGADPQSRSGPNSFARKLSSAIAEIGHSLSIDESEPDARLVFIQGPRSEIPTALRLDGIYFNTRQNWISQNRAIQEAYCAADLIIHQTEFDKRLIERFFGEHHRSSVIRNGADPRKTMATAPLIHPALDTYSQTWVCASSWRPHKRLAENIRYFHEHASRDTCLVVAGDISQSGIDTQRIATDRVFFAGDTDQETLISLYRRSQVLIHLAWLDHCPNVVVDARAAGCRIVCSSSGGTEEVAGLDSVVVEEEEWDLVPLDLYSPPSLDFSRRRSGSCDHKNDILEVAGMYVDAIREIAE